MLTFDAGEFAIRILRLADVQCEAAKKTKDGAGGESFPQTHILYKVIDDLRARCQQHKFTGADNAIHHLHLAIRKGATWSDVGVRIQALRETITKELGEHKFAYVPPEGAAAVDNLRRDWADIWSAFPATKDNASDGIEAFALGLYTASVFQMMIVLEDGITALAANLGVPTGRSTWGTILKKIGDEIQHRATLAASTTRGGLPPSPRAARAIAKLLAFCSEAAKEFSYFKDAWRNYVAHGRARYDENDARKVTIHVRDFMAVLAKNGLKSRKKIAA